MKKRLTTLILFLSLFAPLINSKCSGEEFTLGMVQQHIHTGMPQSEVVACLGSPNMVTKGAAGLETWVYDKISQSTKESYNKNWFFLLLTGRRRGCKKIETSEKTITVVLNFDEHACLENYIYKTSNF